MACEGSSLDFSPSPSPQLRPLIFSSAFFHAGQKSCKIIQLKSSSRKDTTSNHGLLLGSCGLNLGWTAGARAEGGWCVSVAGRCRVPARSSPHSMLSEEQGRE